MSKKKRRPKDVGNDAEKKFKEELEVCDSNRNKRSLGELRKANKTKPRSPDATGKLRLQRHTLQAIVQDFEDADAEEVICNIAGWRNQDQHGSYLTVEISPQYRRYEWRTPKPRIFDDIFNDEDE